MGFQTTGLPQPAAAPMAANGAQVRVPGFFLATGLGSGCLQPLVAPARQLPTPADQGIQASPGDDLSAPNATKAERLNHVVCVCAASVGYSSAAKDSCIPPAALEYDAEITEGPKGYAMTLRMQLTYASSFPKQGMVVWLKKRQQMISDEGVSELMLIETAFEDFVDGRWVPISTDVRYAEEAEAVVQAVITSDSGQTAGRVKAAGAVEDAKLGPVGEQGRILLTYYCGQLYSYGQMALPEEPLAGGGATASGAGRSLVPLAFQLPWAPCDSPAAQCRVSTRVRGPEGCCLLDPSRHVLAYLDLQQSLAQQPRAPAVIVPAAALGAASTSPTWAFSRESLPPVPTAVLVWLSVANDEDGGWEQVGSALPAAQAPCATLLRPSPEDEALLRAALPGCQAGQLLRCRVETTAPARSARVARVHTDITISDASGSTGMNLAGDFTGGAAGSTVRAGFNRFEERRVLARLQAVPALRAAGLLLPDDVWRQHFIVFDHGIRADFELEAKVSDLDSIAVANLLRALAGGDAAEQQAGAAALQQAGQGGLLSSWHGLLERLRAVTPGGTTSFIAGAMQARQAYTARRGANVQNGRTIERTAYVNFDTDGGNNCGPCYDAIQQLVSEADVVQGHVLGVGAWVDQDCASKVAKLLRGSTSLAVSFPEQAAADALLRQDLSRWIKVLRSCPLSLLASAGAVSWAARHGQRSENAAECLLAGGTEGLRFDAPDVSEQAFTKARLVGLQAGESAVLYLLSRLPLAELQQRLRIELSGAEDGTPALVAVGAESLHGVALGHHWLEAFGRAAAGGDLAVNRAALCSRLRERLEDDLSFAWNLPSKSGSTAALGRARTQHRPLVPTAQQPEEPELPKPDVPQNQNVSLFGSAPAWGPPIADKEVKRQRVFGDGALFRASAGGGLFGGSSGGSGAPFGINMSAGLFGGGQFGANTGGGLFGGAAASAFGGGSLPKGPQRPGELLRASAAMRMGPVDVPEADVTRAVRAVKHLANSMSAGGVLPKPDAEDPLVSSVFGQAPEQQRGQQDAVHQGFVCDSCQLNPLVGVRFKASNKADVDVCSACRIAARLAGGAGFRALPEATTLLREAMAALVEWLPLLAWGAAGGPAAPALTSAAEWARGVSDQLAAVRQLPLPDLRMLAQGLPDLPSIAHEDLERRT